MTVPHGEPHFHHPPPVIALPPPSSDNTKPTIYALPAQLSTVSYLHAGYTYEKQLIDLTGTGSSNDSNDSSTGNNTSNSDEPDRINASDPQFAYSTMIANTDLEDYYRLLGLSHLEFNATVNEIKKAYKIVSLVVHPDKATEADREHASELYKATLKAYENLTDLTLRRRYDSSLEFDEEIPEDKLIVQQMKKSQDNFYSIFAPVFQRNGLFSLITPVPSLGNANSTYDEVNAFYDFWFTFKSWRDFAFLNEHQVEQATGRDEKRWMERENAKLQAEQKKLESARIRTLVDRAYKYDPRIKQQIADKEQERKNKKLAKKQALDAKRIDQEQQQKLAAEKELAEKQAREQAAEQEKIAAKQADFLKVQLVQLLKQLELYNDNSNALVLYMQHSDVEQLYKLLNDASTVEQGKTMYTEQLQKYSEYQSSRTAEQKQADEEKNALLQAKLANEKKLFTAEENISLSKSIAKYPAGIKQRWEKITQYHNNQNSVNRTTQEIIKQCKQLEKNMKTVDLSEAEKYKSKLAKPTDNNGKPTDNNGKPTELDVRILEQKFESASISPANSDAWTSSEQSLLEQGLQQYKKDDKERWDKIAALVKSKNKKQSMDRFKWIRDNVVKKK